MSDIITTLHPENDENTNLYPNIKKDNIPINSIDFYRLADDVKELLTMVHEVNPSGADTTENILSKTADDGIWISIDNGHWFYWDGTQYVDSGMSYQAIGNISGENINDKSITPEKLTVWGTGKNLFNKDNSNITYGYQLAVGSNAEYVNANDYISNYIEVEPSTNYVMRRCIVYAFYDAGKNFISSAAGAGGSDSNITTFTTTATTKFVRFTGQISTISLIQLEKGTTPTPYENYKNVLDGSYLKDRSVDSDKLSFKLLSDGYNKYDYSKAIQGYQLTNTNAIYQNANKFYSDYIEVNENSYYSTNGIGVICYYDENKTFISGLNSTGNIATFKTPANTKYVRISGNLAQYNTTCFINKEFYTSYSEYKKVIDPNLFDRDLIPSSSINYGININIPSNIIAVVGHQLNIYYENIIKCNTPLDNFSIVATADFGESLKNCFRVTPIASNIGNHIVTITIYDYNSLLIFRYQFTIKVIADATLDTSTNFVFIGDSNTNTNITYVKELQTMLGTNFHSIGTRSNDGVNHEGRAGWSTQNYVSNSSFNGISNAFWNPSTSKFDFSYWASTNNFSNISMVFITLGTNDRNTSDVVENLKEMIDSIIDYDSNIKVFVSLVTPCSYSQYSERDAKESWVNVKNAYYDMMVKYLNNFNNQNNANVVPININLDCRNDYPESEVAYSFRNPNTYKVITDRYHYSQYGQYKVADVIYNYIINEISE